MRAALALYYKYDVSVVAATNAGKSMAYQAPIVICPAKIAFIISPLNLLMDDQVREGISGISVVSTGMLTL